MFPPVLNTSSIVDMCVAAAFGIFRRRQPSLCRNIMSGKGVTAQTPAVHNNSVSNIACHNGQTVFYGLVGDFPATVCGKKAS